MSRARALALMAAGAAVGAVGLPWLAVWWLSREPFDNAIWWD